MKPTQTSTTNGSSNQILGQFVVGGIMKLTPSVSEGHAKKIVEDCVDFYNKNPEKLRSWHSGFLHKLEDEEKSQLRFEFAWTNESKEDNVATIGEYAWTLRTFGKSGHSGITQFSINPIPYAIELIRLICLTFMETFPKIGFDDVSFIMPTQFGPTDSPVNQIPKELIVIGDVRMLPLYDVADVHRMVEDLVKNYNDFPEAIVPWNHCKLNDETKTQIKFELTWTREPYLGMMCNMESISFKLLSEATKKIFGRMDVVSTNGSLPYVGQLKDNGFDIQIMGYGNEESYHGINENCDFEQMKIGYNIQLDMLERYNQLVKNEITSEDIVDSLHME
jgi:acetylornithine deacetylase/succinyl-diaminopimelate desuccinylase-like protein